MDLDRLFAKGGADPAIVQQAGTNEVLMLAYMNREKPGRHAGNRLHLFFSAGRAASSGKRARRRGMCSGCCITADCDCDTLLVTVEQTGPACHTGSRTCFFNTVKEF